MKTKCTEESSLGDQIELIFDAEDVRPGSEIQPKFVIRACDLLLGMPVEDEVLDGTQGYFEVDALSVFMEEAYDEEVAEIVARCLEEMAAKVRDKFK